MSNFAGSLDTNVLLRILLGDIPDQKAAALSLLHEHHKQFAIADTALYELAFVLGRHYDFTREDIANALKDLMSERQFNCNRVLFIQALELYVTHPALSLEDCALAMYAELNDAVPLYTFDKKLASQVSSTELIAT
jgi:predicted nucleic-acid-binding protein